MIGHTVKGAVLALLSFAIFSTHDVLVKVLGERYSAIQIVFFCVLLGFPLATLMLLRDSADRNLRPRHLGWVVVRSLCTVMAGVFAFYAFSTLPLAQTYAILFAAPLLITLLAIPILGEKVGVRRGAAVVLGLVGVLIVLRPGAAPLSLGHLAALAAAVASSLGSVIVRKLGRDERPVVLILYQLMGNVAVLGLALPFVYRPMPAADLGILAVVALFSLTATALSITAYRLAEAVIVAPMQYSQMIWAVIFGALFFAEKPDVWTLAGAGVIIASGLYIVAREGRGKVSANRPVLESRPRPETGTMPRLGLFQRRADGENRTD